jgi:hypothetical protein
MKSLILILLPGIIFFSCQTDKKEANDVISKSMENGVFKTQDASFVLDTIVTGLKVPYAID